MMNWFDNNGMSGSSMVFMSIFWIVIIGLGIWLVTWLTRGEKLGVRQETPRQILDLRLASGEIDANDYAKSRRLIDGHSIESDKVQ